MQNKKHYVNFGMPKSATTWIFAQLMQNPAVDYTGDKEPEFDVLYDFDSYQSYNCQFDFSINMNVELWSIDSDILKQLAGYATHSSIIYRNPYRFINSAVNYFNLSCSINDYINFVLEAGYLDYTRISQRLKTYFPGMLELTHDQVNSAPQETLDQLCAYLGLPKQVANLKKVNVTQYQQDIAFSDENIAAINGLINRYSDYAGRDLLHWKR